ncbi:hypothetical protein JG687_00003916 [Phytophthora cactorum]|uniref:Uncharacterized protein n=1 Tax=Phytophthora cactorum TaxID=29920 RepID=A0A8T1UQ90_9STRA|nr:hypothetical protein JG687_00003916 [Phytophthora cactorum]
MRIEAEIASFSTTSWQKNSPSKKRRTGFLPTWIPYTPKPGVCTTTSQTKPSPRNWPR